MTMSLRDQTTLRIVLYEGNGSEPFGAPERFAANYIRFVRRLAVKSRPPTAVRSWFWAGSTNPNRRKPKTPLGRLAYAFKTSPVSTPIASSKPLILLA